MAHARRSAQTLALVAAVRGISVGINLSRIVIVDAVIAGIYYSIPIYVSGLVSCNAQAHAVDHPTDAYGYDYN